MFCIANYAKYKYNYIYNNSYNYNYSYNYSYSYNYKNKNNIKYRYNQVQGFWAVYPLEFSLFCQKMKNSVEFLWRGGVEKADKTGHRRRRPLQ